nr:inositol monophosphatase [uncultured Cohaesibacter sp.]
MSELTEKLALVMQEAKTLIEQLEPTSIEVKSKLDYVTNVDRKLDEFLTSRLPQLTPGISVLSEERPFELGKEDFWIIDPIDGTHNMMTGVPFFAVCAALFDKDGAKLSAVLDVVPGDIYVAERGKGATVNGQPLKLERQASTLLAVSSGALDAMNGRPEIYQPFRKLGKLRNLGSQALQLVYVANGKFGCALSQEACFWDDAAARLIAQEAGALYHSFAAENDADYMKLCMSKSPLKSLCAHPDLFKELVKLLSPLW